MADRVLHVRVVSPDRVVHEGEASALVVPAWDGKLGVLPGHAPFLGLLGAGEFVVDLPGGGSRRFHVAGGVLKIEKDEVTVLTEYAGEVPPEEIPPEAVIHPEEVSALAGNPLV
jgi:F-type H+-transporting ATPase subunit epsilon